MNRIFRGLIILAGMVIPNAAQSHTSFPKEIKCPIDKEKFTVYITGSYTTFGSYKDFQKIGAIGDLYESSITSCPKCHFSGYVSDFDTTYTGAIKYDILNILNDYKSTAMTDVVENEITVNIYKYFKKENKEIAWIYVVASYYLRGDSLQSDKRKELQKNAILYMKKALDNKEYEPERVAAIYYLTGEMYRRTEEFDVALKYYDLAINNPDKEDWVEDVAREQRKMAMDKDSNNSI